MAGKLNKWVFAAVLTAASVSVPATASNAPVAPNVGCQTNPTVTYANGAATGARTDGSRTCAIRTRLTGREGSMTVTRRGHVFMAATTKPSGVGLAFTGDNGKTWSVRKVPSEQGAAIGYVFSDPTTDRLFYSSDTPSNLPCGLPLSYSDNEGLTWKTSIIPCEPLPVIGDWGRIFTGVPRTSRTQGYPNVVYYCNFLPAATAGPFIGCWKSLDGGTSFHLTKSFPEFIGDCSSNVDYSIAGRGVVGRTGIVYLPINACGHMEIAISKDEGNTWTRVLVPGGETGSLTTALTSDLGEPGCPVQPWNCPHFAAGFISESLAIDTRDNLYMIWPSFSGVKMASSRNGGQAWSKPTVVSLPGTLASQMSSITATTPGHVAIGYYGRTSAPGWTGYLAYTDNALNATPVMHGNRITRAGNPLTTGNCCGERGYQDGDTLIEYGGVRFAPDGSVWGVFYRDFPEQKQYQVEAGRLFLPTGHRS